jgi:hypothetical protein
MTTPSGLLSWGQAGAYDAIDDRQVIAAVTGYRTGLANSVNIVAGTGLQMTVKAGWSAVVDCGDGTSSVASSRTDQVVTGLAGPASGSRTDLIWLDISPDNATWSMSVINSPPAQGRTGIALATLTVPQGANLASQFTIVPGAPLLERRLLFYQGRTDNRTEGNATWGGADTLVWSTNLLVLPAHWYRVRFTANSPQQVSGTLGGLIGVGAAPANGSEASTKLGRASVLYYPVNAATINAAVEWVFQWPLASGVSQQLYRGRMWTIGSGTFKVNAWTTQGDGLMLTVEDLGL